MEYLAIAITPITDKNEIARRQVARRWRASSIIRFGLIDLGLQVAIALLTAPKTVLNTDAWIEF